MDTVIETDPIRIKNEKAKAYRKVWNAKNRKKILLWHRNHWRELRLSVLRFLSNGGIIACKKCGFSDIRALQVDHIYGGGTKEIGKFKDNQKYLEHIKLSPGKYQILCANCNWIKRHENNEIRAENVG